MKHLEQNYIQSSSQFYFVIVNGSIYTQQAEPFLIKLQTPEKKLPRVDQYASRIPKMYSMKSQQIGHGWAVLSSTANSGPFAKIGQDRHCQLARSFHALFARISCNIFLESLEHTDQNTDQPWVPFVLGAKKSIKSHLSLLCILYYILFLLIDRQQSNISQNYAVLICIFLRGKIPN